MARENQEFIEIPMDYLDLIGLPRLMNLTYGRSDITIGLIDGPVDIEHPDLESSKIVSLSGRGACAYKDSNACAHGTFTAGILNGKRDSKAPGICPGCTLILRQIFSEDTQVNVPRTSPKELSNAIIECVKAGAKIINMSVGLTKPAIKESVLVEALDYALKHRVMIVVSSGNQGIIGDSCLTSHPWVIPVTACDSTGKPMRTSNFGKSISMYGLSAPGKSITSLAPGGKSIRMCGTSVAAPFVTGTIALLWSLFPEATAAEIKFALRPRRSHTIVPPILNALAAYKLLVEEKIPTEFKRSI
jgi:subtilisin family serine protease